MGQTGLTTNVTDWKFQDNYVERLLDNAAYTSAHPDDTLILAGPSRFNASTAANPTNFMSNLLAIGMMQGFQVSQTKPTQPVMAIGSGRQFFVSGKAQTSWNMQRLFVNGRNLLRALYTNAKQAGIHVEAFDDPAAWEDKNEQFWANLDSELFLIPFGLAVFFRDKIHQNVGAFYMELCMLQSWQISFNAGGNLIAEAVTGMADRLVPIYPKKISTGVEPMSGVVAQNYPDATKVDGTITIGADSVYGNLYSDADNAK